MQGCGRKGHRLAGDHGAGAREGAGVIRSSIGVGVDDVDTIRPCAEDRRRDLSVRGNRSVPHLGGADREVIAAVGQHRHCRAGAMLGRRAGIEHRHRHAGALHPIIAGGLWLAASRRQTLLDQVEALIEPVAAEGYIGRVFPHRLDPVLGPDHIFAAKFQRAHGKKSRQLVHRGLDSEGRLRGAIAAVPDGHAGEYRRADQGCWVWLREDSRAGWKADAVCARQRDPDRDARGQAGAVLHGRGVFAEGFAAGPG